MEGTWYVQVDPLVDSRIPIPSANQPANEEMSTKEVPQKKAVLQPQTPDKPFYNEHGAAETPGNSREGEAPEGHSFCLQEKRLCQWLLLGRMI